MKPQYKDREATWPDDLEVDDRVEIDGHTYVVTGTGPGEASIERVGNQDVVGKVFRWAFTGAVGVELKTDFTQEQFENCVESNQQ